MQGGLSEFRASPFERRHVSSYHPWIRRPDDLGPALGATIDASLGEPWIEFAIAVAVGRATRGLRAPRRARERACDCRLQSWFPDNPVARWGELVSSRIRTLIGAIAVVLISLPCRSAADAAEPVVTDRVVLVSVDPAVDLKAARDELDPDHLLDKLEDGGLNFSSHVSSSVGRVINPFAPWNESGTEVWFLFAPDAEVVDGSGTPATPGSGVGATGEEEDATTGDGTTGEGDGTTGDTPSLRITEVPVAAGTGTDPVCGPDGRGNVGTTQPSSATLAADWEAIERSPSGATPRLICSTDALESVAREAAATTIDAEIEDATAPVTINDDGEATIKVKVPRGVELVSVAVESLVELGAALDGDEITLTASDEVPVGTSLRLWPTLRLGDSDVTWPVPEPIAADLEGWRPAGPMDLPIERPSDGRSPALLLLAGLVGAGLGATVVVLLSRRGRPAVATPGGAPPVEVVEPAAGAPPGAAECGSSAPLDPPDEDVLAADLSDAGPPPAPSRAATWSAAWPTAHIGDGAASEDMVYLQPTPSEVEGSLVWASSASTPPLLGIYTEKKVGNGEDAEPTVLREPARRGRHAVPPRAFVAVYDGLGGSGSSRVALRSGQIHTQAFLASRLVRDITERFVVESAGAGGWGDPADLVAGLQARIQGELMTWESRLPATRSKVRSRLQSPFPTTFAGAAITPGSKGKGAGHFVTAVWAGDSRVYLWTEVDGLQQLSADHARGADVLAQLIDDGPMTQKVSAVADWSFSTSTSKLSGPFAVLSATDGVHGYVPTPGALETLLSSTLDQSASTREWGALLVGRIAAYTGDDATVALTSAGFGSFKDFRRALTRRLWWLVETQEQPFDEVDRSDGDAVRACRHDTWDSYRDLYTARLPREAAAESLDEEAGADALASKLSDASSTPPAPETSSGPTAT